MLLVIIVYYILHRKFEDTIIHDTSFTKITNKNHLLFYMKSIVDLIKNKDVNIAEKALLIGIIEMHKTECPLTNCLAKDKRIIYLPKSNEWSDRSSYEINDKVFLNNFLNMIMNFYNTFSFHSADILINLIYYYIETLGNYTKAMLYFKKLSSMNLSYEENVSFQRLLILISSSLVEKLKTSVEGCSQIEQLNTKLYFKYESLSQTLYDEIANTVILHVGFWKVLKDNSEATKFIDFNKTFDISNLFIKLI